jgi:hypothetical protein
MTTANDEKRLKDQNELIDEAQKQAAADPAKAKADAEAAKAKAAGKAAPAADKPAKDESAPKGAEAPKEQEAPAPPIEDEEAEGGPSSLGDSPEEVAANLKKALDMLPAAKREIALQGVAAFLKAEQKKSTAPLGKHDLTEEQEEALTKKYGADYVRAINPTTGLAKTYRRETWDQMSEADREAHTLLAKTPPEVRG